MSQSIWLGRPDGSFNIKIALRGFWVSAFLACLCLTLALYALQSGALQLSPHAVWQALLGDGTASNRMVVVQWRLPRVVMALVLGAALGMSGAIFQSLIRNPLGSPDVIGFNSGAYTGALLAIVLLQANHLQIAGGALLGGLLTAAIIYLLAWNRGLNSFRLIIVGIGISAMLTAVNTWLMISASLESAISAAVWGAGSLSGITWGMARPSALICVFALLAALALSRRMQMLEMGDDSASALGINVERSRLQLMVIGVVLTAAATAVSGPISFIALAAPQMAKQLSRSHSTTLLCSAWMGALLLLAADLVAQHAFSPQKLPVGVVTVSIGGLYLIWLLIRQMRPDSR
ncbi:iron-enterobactin ABC transporter permease [Ketobacter sp.]